LGDSSNRERIVSQQTLPLCINLTQATVLVGFDATAHMLRYFLNSGKEYSFNFQGLVD